MTTMTMMTELIIRIWGEEEKTTPTAVTLDGNDLHQQLIYHLLHLLLRSTRPKHRIIGEKILKNINVCRKAIWEVCGGLEKALRATRVRDESTESNLLHDIDER